MTITNFIKACLRKIGVIDQWILLKLRIKYFITLQRLKKAYGKRKIVVAFCVSEVAKWKAQSLYDKLERTEEYTPVIYAYPSPLDFEQDVSAELLLEEKIAFFKEKNMRVVSVWDSTAQKCVVPQPRPDIIFYQQPWDTPPFPLPLETAGYALSFYIPYYLANHFNTDVCFTNPLHHQLFRYILLNKQEAKHFKSVIKRWRYAGKLLGLGHTIVDILAAKKPADNTNCVIYAPHFSFPLKEAKRIVTFSTFLDNGKLILEFAKQHPEINWVFKPHPRLKYELKENGEWTKAEIDAYYAEWAKIGTVCTTSDYIELFQNSSTMITDCGSFLIEYSCMDKPLIRLYYHNDDSPISPILDKLFDTFYYAHNNGELQELLERVICKKEDPKQGERHREVTALGLNKSDTAQKIVNYLDSLLSGKRTN